MQLNIVNIICAHVEKVLKPKFPIYADVMSDAGKDCACLRHDPAPAAERRFLDGSRLLAWNLTFYIKNKKAAAARNSAKLITDILDGAAIFDPETETLIETEAMTLPQFIGVDEKKQTTYSAAITARYMEEPQEVQ